MASKLIHDNVFNAALTYLETNVDKIQVTDGASVLMSHASSASDIASAWTGPGAGSPDGQQIQFDGLSSLSASGSGSADQVKLIDSATVLLQATLSPTSVNIASSDKVNIGAFTITLRDPT